MILASSRAIYGEGKYNCEIHGDQYPLQRERRKIWKKGEFNPEM